MSCSESVGNRKTYRLTAVTAPFSTATLKPRTSIKGNLLLCDAVFVVALLGSFFFIPLLGQVYPSELLLLGLAPTVLFRLRRSGKLCPGSTFVRFLCLWLLFELAGGLIHTASLQDLSRGAASIGLLASDFVTLAGCLVLIGDDVKHLRRVVRRALLSVAAAGVLGFALVPGLLAREDAWKFGYGFPITLLLVVLAGRQRASVGAVIMLVAAAVNLAFGFRSLALISIITCGIVVYHLRGNGARRLCRTRDAMAGSGRSSTSGSRVGGVVVVMIALVFGAFYIYRGLATSGSLGADSETKYLTQVGQHDSPLGLILGGRRELFFYYQAVIDSPFLGLGPVPRLSSTELSKVLSTIASEGYKVQAPDVEYFKVDAPLPLHSYLLGAIVQAGLAGALTWLWVLRRAFDGALQQRSTALPSVLVVFLSVNLLWNTLFSPFGSSQRILVALALAVILASRRPAEATS